MSIRESPGHGSPGLSCVMDPGFPTLEPEPEPAESGLTPRASCLAPLTGTTVAPHPAACPLRSLREECKGRHAANDLLMP
jgi:hypothetical protein